MKNVIGIGSCLSENVARSMKAQGLGSLLSMVRYNRSDQIMAVMSGVRPLGFEDLKKIIAMTGEMTEEYRITNERFAYGQSAEGMGKNTLRTGIPFVDALQREDVDLVLIDNFMDIRSFLWGAGSGTNLFARLPEDCGLERGARLAPEYSAENFAKIAERARHLWPAAAIVFLHFPCSAYPIETGRPRWAKRFALAYAPPHGTFNFGPFYVGKERLQGNNPHDFQLEVYEEIAGQINGMVLAQLAD